MGKSGRDPEALPYPDTRWLIAEGADDGPHQPVSPLMLTYHAW